MGRPAHGSSRPSRPSSKNPRRCCCRSCPMGESFDVIIIGGGPGGYGCAIRCGQLGLKTAVVERENLGGICLNWGCIPTKALLRSSEIWHLIHRLNEFGFSADNFRFDLAKIVERSRKVSKQLTDGVKFL